MTGSNGAANASVSTVDPKDAAGDSSEARLRQILAAMVAFRDGDFAIRLPTNWTKTEGRLAEAFNQTIAREEQISSEVNRLSKTVGKEGRLKQRMTVPGAIGSWANKIDAFNTLLDDLVRPTADVARTIGAVAKGIWANPWIWKWMDDHSRASSCARRRWSTR